jgi:hypothetical protein
MKFSHLLIIPILLWVIVLPATAQSNEYNLDENYDLNSDGTLFLDSDDAEVTIIGSDRNDVHVNVYHRVDVDGIDWGGDEFKMNIIQRDGNIYIEEAGGNNNSVRIGNIEREYRITINIPKSVPIDIKGDDGAYEISDTGGAIRLAADDSDINIRNAAGEEFTFEIDDGAVYMDKGQGKLSVTIDDGEFRVENGLFNEIDVSGDDGDLYFATELFDNGQYFFSIDDGDLELDILHGGGRIDIAHDDTNINIFGEFSIISDSEERTVYNVSGGSASVEINIEDGELLLRNNK